MSTRHFIPRANAEFNIWQENLIELINPNAANWGIPEEDMDALKNGQAKWSWSFGKASNKQNRSAADVRARDDARIVYEKDLRKFVAQWLTNNRKVTDSDRSRIDITVKLETRTPVAVPVSGPIGMVDFSVRQQHTIHFVDSLTGGKAKPEGFQGCEIWTKAGGEAPKDDSDFVYPAMDTKTPFSVIYTAANIGKVIYYRMRWINKRGRTGPWSSTISAIVGA